MNGIQRVETVEFAGAELECVHWACVVLITTHDSTGRHQEISMIEEKKNERNPTI